MTRVLGFGLFVIALLVSVELYVNGTGRLLGEDSEQLVSPIARSERAASSFQRAWNSSADRVERVLDDPS